MPTFDIVKRTQPAKTFRIASIMGTYDLQSNAVEEHFVGNLDIPNDWQVGLIVGNSGTGKTTIAKELFPDAYVAKYEYKSESVLDDMPANVQVSEITKMFCSVGFASVPSWLKPYAVLSNGEKMRVDLARALLEQNEIVVFDEFTSVVDRNIAKIGSFATQNAIRKSKKKFIAVSCHFDVEDWLLPDWVFDTNSMTFRLCEGQKKNRPECELRIYETAAKDYYWNIFRKYHYLSHSFNKAARVFVATLNGNLCAFSAVLPFPHPKLRNAWRAHRTVVLPDFQGLNIGMHITHCICEQLAQKGKSYITTTSNPARIAQLKKDKSFVCMRCNRKIPGRSKISLKCNSKNRITASFRYIGNKHDEQTD